MYFNDLIQGEAAMTRTKVKIIGLGDVFSYASRFINYFETWSRKTSMWIMGNQIFSRCGHNTNIVIESYHVNLIQSRQN